MSPEHSIDTPWPSLRQIFNIYPCAFDREGNKIFGKPLPQLESELTALFNDIQARGTVLVTVPNLALLVRFPSRQTVTVAATPDTSPTGRCARLLVSVRRRVIANRCDAPHALWIPSVQCLIRCVR